MKHSTPGRRYKLNALFAAAIFLSVATMQATDSETQHENGQPLRIHLISGSREYESERSLRKWQAGLEATYDVKITGSFAEDRGDDLPDIEALPGADLLIVFARRVHVPEDQLRLVKAHCEAGKAVIGIRTASHAFQNWPAFDRMVLGGSYSGHAPDDPAVEVNVAAGAASHPVLAGVRPWTRQGKLYYNRDNTPDTRTLLVGAGRTGSEPLAWVHHFNGGRVFYTSMGHPHDFQHPQFRRLLHNAVEWTIGRPLEPVTANR